MSTNYRVLVVSKLGGFWTETASWKGAVEVAQDRCTHVLSANPILRVFIYKPTGEVSDFTPDEVLDLTICRN